LENQPILNLLLRGTLLLIIYWLN